VVKAVDRGFSTDPTKKNLLSSALKSIDLRLLTDSQKNAKGFLPVDDHCINRDFCFKAPSRCGESNQLEKRLR